ncbi:helix-turn-helix domain-containing protein [Anaerocolumna sp. MB42-C2]|uniref:helix-turn-helix domain-containing protein n=1 Tax=Anaerocolumna sp. MB42-C2 TaxID=3070997 RepID=UPI0027E07ADE|nr:helix-turn-helix domain-containing protein [Anaerocolumna sp. MB42-C2]WMJ86523.1 helix-turn-helix domain-containing protein [Anaerocolumna sp. MB42-C2]
MRIKKILDSLTYEKQMFMKLLVLVTIPLIVMGIVSCNIYISSESSKRYLTLSSYSDEISGEYGNIFSSLKEYYIDNVNGDRFRWLVSQKDIPYSRISNMQQAQRILGGTYFMEKYISNYEFINIDHGWVFNKYGMFPYEKTWNRDEVNRFLNSQKEMMLSVYWLNREGTRPPKSGNFRNSNSIDSSGLLLVIKNEHEISGMSWLLLVQIDEKELNNLSDSYKKLGYDVTILANDKVILNTNSDMTESYLKEGMKGSGIYRSASGKKYNINVRNGETDGLTFVIGYDKTKINKDATIFVMASFVVIAVFVLLLVIIRLTAMAFSKPLLVLQEFVKDQNLQIKELFVSNLLKGELNEERIENSLKKYGITVYPAYRMIAITCKGTDDRLKEKYGEILSGLPEKLKKRMFITPVYYEERLVFLVGAEIDIEVDNKTVALYKEIKDYIAENFGMATASGISQPFHKLHHVRKAYNECAQAISNKANTEDTENSSLALFDDYLAMNSQENVYDMIIENELILAIDSCKDEEAGRLLELTIVRMEMKSVVGIERNFYLTRLLTAILNIPGSAGVALSDIFDSEQYNILNSITQIYGKQELVKAISREIIDPIIHKLLKKRQESQESEILTQVIKLLKDSRGNITLNECADRLCYHPNYLSKVLKHEQGVTFTDIANKEKLKQAKYMLLTTECSVAEISEKLQYNNVQNFIRFFKNHMGFTPAAFRKEHRQ